MQPTRTQVPPSTGSFSTSATSRPSCPPRTAATYPPGPAPTMTTSCLLAPSAAISDLQQHAGGVLDGLLDALEERHALAAVDDAVVVRERDVHHGPHDHLTVAHDGALLDRVHAEDARLRGVHDRRREQRAEHAAVADRERAALELLGLGEREPVGVLDDGHDQALLRRDGHADVVVVLVDDVVAVDLGVELRDQLQGVDHGLDEERHEAEPHAVALLERLAVLLAQR